MNELASELRSYVQHRETKERVPELGSQPRPVSPAQEMDGFNGPWADRVPAQEVMTFYCVKTGSLTFNRGHLNLSPRPFSVYESTLSDYNGAHGTRN